MRSDLLVLLRSILVLFAHWVALHVRVDDESRQLVVDVLLHLISDHGEDIETR